MKTTTWTGDGCDYYRLLRPGPIRRFIVRFLFGRGVAVGRVLSPADFGNPTSWSNGVPGRGDEAKFSGPIARIEYFGASQDGCWNGDFVDHWRIRMSDESASPLDFVTTHMIGIGFRKEGKIASKFALCQRYPGGSWGVQIHFRDQFTLPSETENLS